MLFLIKLITELAVFVLIPGLLSETGILILKSSKKPGLRSPHSRVIWAGTMFILASLYWSILSFFFPVWAFNSLFYKTIGSAVIVGGILLLILNRLQYEPHNNLST